MPEPRAVRVSRRAYGSKIRSRHSSGIPGPSSATPMRTPPSAIRQSSVIVVSGGAYLTAFSTRCSRIWRRRAGSVRANSRMPSRSSSRWRASSGASSVAASLDDLADVRRLEVRGRLGADPHGGENRVDQPVQPLDLLHRRAVPAGPALAPLLVPRLAAVERRVLRQEVRVGADDRERRPQLVGHQRDQLGAGVVDLLELGRALLGLALHPALLDDAAEEVGDRAEVGHVGRREVAMLLGLDVEDADDRSFQTSGTESIEAMNRLWSMPRTHRKRSSWLTSGITSGSRDSATRPVTPPPNGTLARPIW